MDGDSFSSAALGGGLFALGSSISNTAVSGLGGLLSLEVPGLAQQSAVFAAGEALQLPTTLEEASAAVGAAVAAPTSTEAPAKRPRGRPRKVPLVASPDGVEPAQPRKRQRSHRLDDIGAEPEDEEQDGDTRPVKRGPGRPRKHPLPVIDGSGAGGAGGGEEDGDNRDVDEAYGEQLDLVAEASAAIKKRRNKRMRGRKTMRAHGGQLPFELSQVMGEANTAWALGDIDDAIAKCKFVIAKAPSFAPPYSLLGLSYESQGKNDLALDAYRLAAAAATEDSASWKRLGILAKECGDDRLARDSLARAARLAPDDLAAALDAANMYEAAGEARRAGRMLRLAAEHPKLPAPATTLLKVVELFHAAGDQRGVREALIDCINYCMGLDAPASVGSSGAGAAQGGHADKDNAGAGAGATAATDAAGAAQAKPTVSRFRGGTGTEVDGADAGAGAGAGAGSSSSDPSGSGPLKARPDLYDQAVNAANMLAEVHNGANEHGSVLRLVDRTRAYSVASGRGETLPLDLEMKRAVAQLWVGDDSPPTPTDTFRHLWEQPLEEYADLYLEAGLALARTGKPRAAIEALGRLRTAQPMGAPVPDLNAAGQGSAGAASSSSGSAAASNSAANTAAVLACITKVFAAPTLPTAPSLGIHDAIADPQLRVTMLVAEADSYLALELPAYAALYRTLAARLNAHDHDLVTAAADALSSPTVGLHKEAVDILTNSQAVRSSPTEQAVARLFMKAEGIARGAGDTAGAAELLLNACGAGFPLENANNRAKRVVAAQQAVGGSEKFLQLVEDACRVWGTQERHSLAVRLLDVVMQASEAAKTMSQAALTGDGRRRADKLAAGQGVRFAGDSADESDDEDDQRQSRGSDDDEVGDSSDEDDESDSEGEGAGASSKRRRRKLDLDRLREAAAEAALHAGQRAYGPPTGGLRVSSGTSSRKHAGDDDEDYEYSGTEDDSEDDDEDMDEEESDGVSGDGSADDGDEGPEDGDGCVRRKPGKKHKKSKKASMGKALRRLGKRHKQLAEPVPVGRINAAIFVERLQLLASRLEEDSSGFAAAFQAGAGIDEDDNAKPADAGAGSTGPAGAGATVPAGPGPSTSAPAVHVAGRMTRLRPQSALLAHPVSETLLAGVRRVAGRYPYHLGVWTLCRLLDNRSGGASTGERGGMIGGTSGSFSSAFRKAMVRYQTGCPDSLPLLMLVGSECLLSRTYRYAVGVFFEAYRLAPRDPLVSLCLGVSFLGQVMSRVTTHRHAEALRALAFISRYQRLRREQASGGLSVQSVTCGAAAGAATAGPGKGGIDERSCIPQTLPTCVAEAETCYTVARAAHQLGLMHIAVQAYMQALQAWDREYAAGAGSGPQAIMAGVSTDGGLEGQATDAGAKPYYNARVLSAMDIRREAAYNLCLVLKGTGAEAEAARITAMYLSYD